MKKTIKEKITMNLINDNYDIIIGNDLIKKSGELIRENIKNTEKIFIISDDNVFPLYGNKLIKSLENQGFKVYKKIIKAGEKSKNLNTVSKLYNSLINKTIERDSTVISLGGGVVGDLAGFIAATYMRGINFVQIPTTLLAQVDSSIGGKVAVNHPKAKNLIGNFYQPSLVISDVKTLETLEKREFISGMGEVIKHGYGFSRDYFNYINSNKKDIMNLENDILIKLIYGSCQIKKEIVEKDEKDKGIRAKLNLGHTIGHALEKITKFSKYSHGEAVAIGLIYETKLSQELGLIKSDILKKIRNSLQSFSLADDFKESIKAEEIINAIKYDKKLKKGKVVFSLPRAIGDIIITSDYTEDDLKATLSR